MKRPPIKVDLLPGFAVQGEHDEVLYPEDNPHTVGADFGAQLLASGRAVPYVAPAAASAPATATKK